MLQHVATANTVADPVVWRGLDIAKRFHGLDARSRLEAIEKEMALFRFGVMAMVALDGMAWCLSGFYLAVPLLSIME